MQNIKSISSEYRSCKSQTMSYFFCFHRLLYPIGTQRHKVFSYLALNFLGGLSFSHACLLRSFCFMNMGTYCSFMPHIKADLSPQLNEGLVGKKTNNLVRKVLGRTAITWEMGNSVISSQAPPCPNSCTHACAKFPSHHGLGKQCMSALRCSPAMLKF